MKKKEQNIFFPLLWKTRWGIFFFLYIFWRNCVYIKKTNVSIKFQVQTEIAYVTKHREEVLAAMDPKQRQERLDICRKLEEKVCTVFFYGKKKIKNKNF